MLFIHLFCIEVVTLFWLFGSEYGSPCVGNNLIGTKYVNTEMAEVINRPTNSVTIPWDHIYTMLVAFLIATTATNVLIVVPMARMLNLLPPTARPSATSVNEIKTFCHAKCGINAVK